jgi:hypothetical protein
MYGGNYPEGNLLNSSNVELAAIGVKMSAPQLLMAMRKLE